MFRSANSGKDGSLSTAQTQLDLARWLPPIRPLLLPLPQPDGHRRTPVIHPGESATRFQVLARGASETGCDLLAPTEGRVLGHTGAPTPAGWCDHAVELRCDTATTTVIFETPDRTAPGELVELLDFARRFGLVDLTAERPLAATLAASAEADVDHLIINALDPLPDCLWHADLLRFAGRPIADAGALVAKLLQIANVDVVAPPRAKALFPALMSVARTCAVALPNIYPHAHPRLVSAALLGDRFPYDRPLTDAGVLVLDVQTLYAVGEALATGQPFTWRWVFVGGDAVERPGLYRVFIGTRVADVLAAARPTDRVSAVVANGLLNGVAVTSPDCIVSSVTTSFHFLTDAATPVRLPSACVRCGWCQESCPVNLDPRAIFHALEIGRAAIPKRLHPGACIECGLCSYVCPADLDLSHAARIAMRLARPNRRSRHGETAP